MSRIEIDVEAGSAARPERVWALLADARSWTQWAGFEEAHVEQGEGVGEVRRYRRGRVTGRDRVTALEPSRRFAYESVSRLPVRDYRGEVTLTAAPEAGTLIRWNSTFAPKIPGTGWLLRRGLRRFLGELAHGLAREAEKDIRGSQRSTARSQQRGPLSC